MRAVPQARRQETAREPQGGGGSGQRALRGLPELPGEVRLGPLLGTDDDDARPAQREGRRGAPPAPPPRSPPSRGPARRRPGRGRAASRRPAGSPRRTGPRPARAGRRCRRRRCPGRPPSGRVPVSPSPSSSPVRSCRNVRSPISANAGPPPVRACTSAAPTAVEIVPSMPATPRLARTVRSPRGTASRSTSRTGVEDPSTSREPAGARRRRRGRAGPRSAPARRRARRRPPCRPAAAADRHAGRPAVVDVPPPGHRRGDRTRRRRWTGWRRATRRDGGRLDVDPRVGEQRGDRPGQGRPADDDDPVGPVPGQPAGRTEQQRPAAHRRRRPCPARRLRDDGQPNTSQSARRPRPRTPGRRRRRRASAPRQARSGEDACAVGRAAVHGAPSGRPAQGPASSSGSSSSGISGSRRREVQVHRAGVAGRARRSR